MGVSDEVGNVGAAPVGLQGLPKPVQDVNQPMCPSRLVLAHVTSRWGVLVLAAGATVTAGAYWVMVRIGRLPEDERVLR